MNRSQKKMLLRLAGMVLLLLAVLLIVLGVKRHKARQEEEAAQQQAAEGVIVQERAYSALTYSNGSATLSFSVDADGSWIWADDPDFPLDDATVTSIVDLISNLKPQQTITDGDTMEAYGLDQPSMTLTATSAEDGGTLTIALGKATTDGNSYYMLMNGDESTVYIIADSLYQKMSVPIYDMCRLPELPALTADTLVSLTVAGTETTTLTAQRPESASAGESDSPEDSENQTAAITTWRSGGANVTDDPTVTALLEDLSHLTLTKCVDFKPSDEAAEICGFTEPTAVLTAKYLGNGEVEQTFVLSVGAALPGSSGDSSDYYVRVDDDTTIYQMSGTALATLLSLAEAGLEA